MRKLLFKFIAALSVLIMLTGQQVSAFTANDYYCSNMGGLCFYDPNDCNDSDTGSSATVVLTGSSNEAKVWNYFSAKSLKPELVAGIMGNIARESGFDPENIENSAGGRTKDPSGISAGWGLIQWTPGSKILQIAKDQGVTGPIYELSTQLDIIWNHMNGTAPNGTQHMIEGYKNISTSGAQGASDAADYFESHMESAGVKASADREAAAKAAFQKYGSGGSSAADSAPATSEASADGSSGGCNCPTSGTSTESANDLSDVLEDLADKNGGQTTISVSSVDGRVTGQAGGNVQMPTRSSYKIYTAYATLRAIEAGDISWSTKIWNGATVEDTMQEMIVKSNNDAAEALRTDSRIGTPREVTDFLQNDIGLSNKTVMGSGKATDTKGTNSQSTANDFTKFLVLLAHKDLIGVKKDSNYEKLLDYMKQATTDGHSARDGIVAGVGGGIEVADKPGWASDPAAPASNDVGIVYYKSNPYVISILSDKPFQWSGVAAIAKAVHEKISSGDVSTDSGSDCGDGSTGGLGGGGLINTVKDYAWPDYHPAPYLSRKPAYATAVATASKKGLYVGGTVGGVAGIDCGGFVTRVMLDSGYEPEYNSSGKGGATGSPDNPGTQWGWLDKNWQKLNPKSTKDLQPGDVAINSSHTYMYVGKVEGFNSVVASASYGESSGRAPMAGHEAAASPNFTWYRKK